MSITPCKQLLPVTKLLRQLCLHAESTSSSPDPGPSPGPCSGTHFSSAVSQQPLSEPCFSSLCLLYPCCAACALGRALTRRLISQLHFRAFSLLLCLAEVAAAGAGCSQRSLGAASLSLPTSSRVGSAWGPALLSGLLHPSCCSWAESWPLLSSRPGGLTAEKRTRAVLNDFRRFESKATLIWNSPIYSRAVFMF